MTNAELIKALRRCSYMTVADALNEDYCKPCAYYKRGTSNASCIKSMMIDAADALEAAEKRIAGLEAQMPKEGSWKKILQNDDGTSDYQCSACLGIIENVPDDDEHPLCSFCPNCGARIGKENADADS